MGQEELEKYRQKFGEFTQKYNLTRKRKNTLLPDNRWHTELILTGLTYIGTGIGTTQKQAQANALVNWCHYMDKNQQVVKKEIEDYTMKSQVNE